MSDDDLLQQLDEWQSLLRAYGQMSLFDSMRRIRELEGRAEAAERDAERWRTARKLHDTFRRASDLSPEQMDKTVDGVIAIVKATLRGEGK